MIEIEGPQSSRGIATSYACLHDIAAVISSSVSFSELINASRYVIGMLFFFDLSFEICFQKQL